MDAGYGAMAGSCAQLLNALLLHPASKTALSIEDKRSVQLAMAVMAKLAPGNAVVRTRESILVSPDGDVSALGKMRRLSTRGALTEPMDVSQFQARKDHFHKRRGRSLDLISPRGSQGRRSSLHAQNSFTRKKRVDSSTFRRTRSNTHLKGGGTRRKWYIILPEESALIFFQGLISVCVLYVIIWVPVDIAFEYTQRTSRSIGMNVALELLFITDTIVPFFTAYYSKNEHIMVTDPTRIRRHALRSSFLLDLISSIPIETYLLITKSSSRQGIGIKLFRCLKLAKVSALVQGYRHKMSADHHLGTRAATILTPSSHHPHTILAPFSSHYPPTPPPTLPPTLPPTPPPTLPLGIATAKLSPSQERLLTYLFLFVAVMHLVICANLGFGHAHQWPDVMSFEADVDGESYKVG
jgi:hypothetical protein